MDFFTDLMGLILLIVCILIVLIFLKDYIRLGGKKTTVNKKQKMIVYEVHQNNKRIQQGWITWCIVQNCPVMVKRDSQRRKNWWLRTAIPGKQCTL